MAARPQSRRSALSLLRRAAAVVPAAPRDATPRAPLAPAARRAGSSIMKSGGALVVYLRAAGGTHAVELGAGDTV
eukprot:gene8316-3922_t